MPDMPLGLTDAELIAAVGSIFLPLGVAFVMRQTWSDRVRMFVTYVLYFIYTLGTMWFLNQLVFDETTEAKEVFRGFLFVAIIAYTSFKAYWQPSGITARLEARTN